MCDGSCACLLYDAATDVKASEGPAHICKKRILFFSFGEEDRKQELIRYSHYPESSGVKGMKGGFCSTEVKIKG